MATQASESDHGCYPWEDMVKAHEMLREEPEMPDLRENKKLMQPPTEAPEG